MAGIIVLKPTPRPDPAEGIRKFTAPSGTPQTRNPDSKPLDPPRLPQHPNLLIRKHSRPDQKSNTLSILQRKHPPASQHHIQDQLRMLPILKLALTHIKRSCPQRCHQHIAVPDIKLSPRITHRGAAPSQQASRLMKHQLPMFFFEPAHQLLSSRQSLLPCSGTLQPAFQPSLEESPAHSDYSSPS